jgi:hypothetical protein
MLGRHFTEENAGRVGLKWWSNFVKRHKVHLIIGKIYQFDMKRNEWCKLEKFQKMYDFIYNKLEEKVLTEAWETEKMLDTQGNEVIHNEKLIFVDKVGASI